jgi:hypothetical protein
VARIRESLSLSDGAACVKNVQPSCACAMIPRPTQPCSGRAPAALVPPVAAARATDRGNITTGEVIFLRAAVRPRGRTARAVLRSGATARSSDGGDAQSWLITRVRSTPPPGAEHGGHRSWTVW